MQEESFASRMRSVGTPWASYQGCFVETPAEYPGKAIIVKCLSDSVLVRLITKTPGATLFYTLDGSQPTSSSAKYKKPFVVRKPQKLLDEEPAAVVLKAFATAGGFKESNVMMVQFVPLDASQILETARQALALGDTVARLAGEMHASAPHRKQALHLQACARRHLVQLNLQRQRAAALKLHAWGRMLGMEASVRIQVSVR